MRPTSDLCASAWWQVDPKTKAPWGTCLKCKKSLWFSELVEHLLKCWKHK